MSGEREPGEVIAGYTIERILGHGGMGTVYLAQHPNLPRKVALKVLHGSWVHDDYIRARFESEADHVARLEHPHIVAIHDRGREGDELWIAMQFVPGVDARSALAFGPLDTERVARIVTEIGDALDFAHRAGVLHRDVKPANILLSSGDPELAFLADFGTAKALDETHHLTRTGMVVATLLYAAPEQIEAQQIDHRVDIYALGCTCFHLMAGTPPYIGSTASAVIRGHLEGKIPRISSVRPQLPTALDAVVARAMAKNRDERYSTCREFGDAVRAALDGGRVQAATEPVDRETRTEVSTPSGETVAPPHTPQANGPRSLTCRRMTVVATLAAIVLAAAAAVTYIVWPGPEPHGEQVVLAIRDLQKPAGLSIDSNGDLYIADRGAKRVSVVHNGSDTPTALAFTGLEYPIGVAITITGAVLVSDRATNKVSMLYRGAQWTLPFKDLNQPIGLAQGQDGTTYVADLLNNRVVALSSPTDQPVVLPVSVIGPFSVAVNKTGDVYIGTPNKVMVWNATTRAQSFLPFDDLNSAAGVALDSTGTLYVNDQDHHRILKLPPESHTPEVLPFTGLGVPEGLAVTPRGDVYVADTDNSRIVMLPADN